VPVFGQCGPVEEAQGRDRVVESTPTYLLFLDQVDLVSADLLGAELIRGPPEMPRILCHGCDIGLLRTGCKVADLHVIEHALAKRIHRDSFRSHSRPQKRRTEPPPSTRNRDSTRSAYRRRRFRSSTVLSISRGADPQFS